MNPARISIAVLLLLASAVCASTQTLKKKKLVLSVSDKKEIVRQVFEDGFENSSKYTRWIFGEGDHYEL